MQKNKSSYYYEERNLSDVFKELQEIKNNPAIQKHYIKNSNKKKSSFLSDFKYTICNIKLSHFAIAFVIVFILIALFCNKNILANSNTPQYETNNNVLNLQDIILQNANINTFKKQSIIEANIIFPTIYTNNPSLPKGEQVITKEGTFGKEIISSVTTYENKELIEEIILSKERILDPTPQLVDVGTSEFLAKHNVHIGDTLYLTKDFSLKEDSNDKSKKIIDIKKYMDVKLLELTNEQWCRISFDDSEGFIKTSTLTSATSTPDIVEKNRIQRILFGVNINMPLNQSSNLTKNDYKKIFSDLPQDKKHIFKDNYEVFYNADKKYNINGIFLASIAAHESNWGISTIANNKKNLFGFGAYDRSPYESSFEFNDYAAGIDSVARFLVDNYLNSSGTEIYDNQKASGRYYNEPTVEGVNVRYASDKEWHKKVFKYMQLFYDKLGV